MDARGRTVWASDTLMAAWGNRLTEMDVNVLAAYLRSLESNASPMAP